MNRDGSNELRFEITIDPNAFISKFEANIDGETFIGDTKEKVTVKESTPTKEENPNSNAISISQPHKNIPNVFEITTNVSAKGNIILTLYIEQYLQKKFGFDELNIQILRNFGMYNIAEKIKYISFGFDVKDHSGIYDTLMTNNASVVIDKQQISPHRYQIKGRILCNSALNEFIFKYKIKGEQQSSHVLFDEKSKSFCHVISEIITDSAVRQKILIPRRLVIIIDRSGSMSGLKWKKTIAATITALQQLRVGYDRYCIILCGDNLMLYPCARIAVADTLNVIQCIKHLKRQHAMGAELINDALLTAVKLIKDDIRLLNHRNNKAQNIYNFFANQIVLVTDGKPTIGETDTDRIRANVRSANDLSSLDQYSRKISVHTFGIGRDNNDSSWVTDLNHSFLQRLSLENDGFYQRVKQSNTAVLLAQYFSILSTPLLCNIGVEYRTQNLKHLTQTNFNTFYSGNDLVICGKFRNLNSKSYLALHDSSILYGGNVENYTLNVSITAITGQSLLSANTNKMRIKPVQIRKQIKLQIPPTVNKTVERIWCYVKLAQFANQKLLTEKSEQKRNSDAFPLSLALKAKFITPWTAMCVCKKETKTWSSMLDIDPTNEGSANPQISSQSQSPSRAPHPSSLPKSLRNERKKNIAELIAESESAQKMNDTNNMNPLTAEMLKDANESQKKRLIGERLFPKVQSIEPRLAGKITAILLKLDNTELLVLLSEQRSLTHTVNEVLTVVKLRERIKQEFEDLKSDLSEDSSLKNVRSLELLDSDETKWTIAVIDAYDGKHVHSLLFDLEMTISMDYPLKHPKCRIVNAQSEGIAARLDLESVCNGWTEQWTIKKLLVQICDCINQSQREVLMALEENKTEDV